MLQSCTSRWVTIALVLAGSAAISRPAHAQVNAGVRGGLSVDPDQVYFGGHIETQPLIDRLRFRPNVEVGVGSDTTLVAFNFEFTYSFPSRQPWHLYVGGGPTMNWWNINDHSSTGAGFTGLGGVENNRGLFFEAKIGAGDSPNLKFGVGFTFK
jgi:hypothetical protein